MKYFSIYLVFHWFCSSEFCSFSHIGLVHILLDLYLSITFLRDTNEMILGVFKFLFFFLISNSTSLLIYTKMINYCMLSFYPACIIVYYLQVFCQFFGVFYVDHVICKWRWYCLLSNLENFYFLAYCISKYFQQNFKKE